MHKTALLLNTKAPSGHPSYEPWIVILQYQATFLHATLSHLLQIPVKLGVAPYEKQAHVQTAAVVFKCSKFTCLSSKSHLSPFQRCKATYNP